MSVDFIFIMLIVGICSILTSPRRLTFLWSVAALMSCAFGIISLLGPQMPKDFSVTWDAIPNLPVGVGFSFSSVNPVSIIGILLLSILALYYIIFDTDEKKKKQLNGLILLNCILVVMTIGSVNYIQLLVAVGVADVVIYSAINRPEAKRQYIFGNFLSDFILLNILALILGQYGNVSILGIEKYSQDWHHRDYIGIMLLLCVLIKVGAVFFHSAYQKMSELNFVRLNFILFLATPLLGFLVLQSLNDVLSVSEYSYPLLACFSVAGFAWSSAGTMMMDNIKRKAVYFSMFFWSAVLACFMWLSEFKTINFYAFLTAAFLFNSSMALLYRLSGKQLLMSKMNGCLKNSKTAFVIILLSVVLYGGCWYLFCRNNPWLMWPVLILFMLISSQLISEAYFGDFQIKIKLLSRIIVLGLPIIAGLLWLYHNIEHDWPTCLYAAGILICWFAIFIFRPLRKISKAYGIDTIQKSNLVTSAYNLLIMYPLQILGRGLRLIVDFIFVERTIMASIKSTLRFMIFIFRQLHNDTVWNYILFSSLGAAIVLFAYYSGGIR